ncbi:MAG: glycosyltransferase family 2 protein [Butyrivibrio sp.]|nr:glycosyltransferase family 2 protein [Butyrivibrio sp.]
MLILSGLFWISAFIIVWAMGGYELALKVLSRVFKNRKLQKDYDALPTVTVMIVAHNEEKVMEAKLENAIDNDYPADKIDYIVTSDFSTDATEEIVEQFIAAHPDLRIRLHRASEHKGKTNAQNEAQKLVQSEILVMTDANAMFERNAVTELAACFTSPDVAYVAGRLAYRNTDNGTAEAESVYWELDLSMRETESRIKTITAGNGAIYACRNALYVDLDPIKCHDAYMPRYYGLQGYRAVYNPDAVAYEKAGETLEDEFKRKVRMNRYILPGLAESLPCLNIFRHGWFSFFYFGHRVCRRMLWISHAAVYLCSLALAVKSRFFKLVCAGQTLFYLVAVLALKTKTQKKLPKMMGYYTMTIAAQWMGAINCMTGKSKATWDQAESTR